MKHGKRPTWAQRELMEMHRLNPGNWLVVKDTPAEMHLVKRESGMSVPGKKRTVRVIRKKEDEL